MIRPGAFTLRLREIGGADIAGAAWGALIASGWVMYNAQLLAYSASGRPAGEISEREHIEAALRAFDLVLQYVGDGPIKDELARYVREAIPQPPAPDAEPPPGTMPPVLRLV